MAKGQEPIVNALTVDVEDYFHVSAFESVCDPRTWQKRECRVEGNTSRILELLAAAQVKATFFVLGWVAERFPGLVKGIAAAGHEVASHGHGHRRIYTLTREEFREDLRRSKGFLEDLTGERLLGYRAPSYSISPTCLWAFDELLEAGYRYDSSVFPIRHDLYGISDWPRFPFVLERLGGQKTGTLGSVGNWAPVEHDETATVGTLAGGMGEGKGPAGNALGPTALRASRDHAPRPSPTAAQPSARFLEIPITTLRLLGRNVPIAGGGYFRLFPYGFTRWGLRRINELEGQPFIFYLHPWELDPNQPRISGVGLKSRFRHYLNLQRTEDRFRRLLAEFHLAPLREVVLPGSPLPACPTGGSLRHQAGGHP
jgi:polysaccharide deacetylase family protein (PEP-CTERM system associated)